MGQGHAEIVVGAEGVVPGQPVHEDRRGLGEEGEALQQHDLVGHEHALGVHHGLWLAGGARGQQELGDRVGADGGEGRIDARIVGWAVQARQVTRAGEIRVGGGDDQPVRRGSGGERGAEGLCIGDEDEAGVSRSRQ